MLTELFNRRVVAVTALGFASGLPLALSDSTMQAWLVSSGVDVATIGLFSLVGLPYVLKFLWAPMLDRFQPGWPGRRKDWILLAQFGLIVSLIGLGFTDYVELDLSLWLAVGACLLALLSATQDIAIDAYRTEILTTPERGFGAGAATTGYRIAMLASGAGALLLAERIGFASTYACMALLLALGVLTTLLAPAAPRDIVPPRSLSEAVVGPLREFFARPEAIMLLLLIFLYKLGDAFAGRLAITFLLRELGFSLTDVGAIYKALGLVSSIAGALYGGALMYRIGLYQALLMFAWLQAVTNLGFLVLSLIEPSYIAMTIVVGLENLSGGMGTAAFVALLMACCHRRYTATQFAMLTAVASLGRVFAGPPSGFLVEAFDWPVFFALTFLIALPAIVLIRRQQSVIHSLTLAP